MPVASINPDETTRLDLKTLPEGFVVLRRLSYGDWLTRQEMAITVELGNKGGGGEVKMANRVVTEWEFKQCIVDHNLEMSAGVPMDFNQAGILKSLDPKVGTEIAAEIMSMHDFEASLPN